MSNGLTQHITVEEFTSIQPEVTLQFVYVNLAKFLPMPLYYSAEYTISTYRLVCGIFRCTSILSTSMQPEVMLSICMLIWLNSCQCLCITAWNIQFSTYRLACGIFRCTSILSTSIQPEVTLQFVYVNLAKFLPMPLYYRAEYTVFNL